MKVLDILQYTKLPKKSAEPVKEITQEVKDLCIDMCIAMRHHNGIGLAAPQVGVNKRIIIINALTFSESNFCIFMINPEILECRGEQINKEGCLSFSKEYVKVKRPKKITVKYTNTQGDVLIQNFDGLAAAVVCHELDHLSALTMKDKKGYKV